jgi:hypothetical protein
MARDSEIDEPLRDALLASLRAALIRAKLLEADITAIGVALKHGLISAKQARMALQDLGIPTVFDIGSRPGDTWSSGTATLKVDDDVG